MKKKKWVRKTKVQKLWCTSFGLLIILQKKHCWWAIIQLLCCTSCQVGDLFGKFNCQMFLHSLLMMTKMVVAWSTTWGVNCSDDCVVKRKARYPSCWQELIPPLYYVTRSISIWDCLTSYSHHVFSANWSEMSQCTCMSV